MTLVIGTLKPMNPAIEPKNSVLKKERTQAMRKPHHGKVDFRL
jgi:hypothetical protein